MKPNKYCLKRRWRGGLRECNRVDESDQSILYASMEISQQTPLYTNAEKANVH
jgi:hypothetical protein